MAQVIKTTFKFRRNLASYWAEKNPVLAEGEPCFELDTGKLKVGNGTTAYNDLPYINSTTTVINGDDISIVVNNNVITLKGFDEATTKSVPRKNNGALEWVEMLTKGEIEDMLAYKQDALTPGVNVEFTDDDIIKVLPVAMSDSVSETALAGAKDVWEKMPKPVAKTDTMIQEVGMSTDGKLYTARSEVKTSTSDNGVTIKEDGTMEVNSVDVNKLSQSPDEELVMNGELSNQGGIYIMAKELNTRIQLKHGLAASWTKSNPILLAGEMGIETDTLKMKVGDGTSNWSALGYLGADANDILAIINKNRDSCTTVEVAEGQSDAEALATISNPKNGDTAVLIKAISGDKKSYTAFVYDNAWKAMDGNYNASNVYFDKDLTYTVGIGTLAKPSSSATFNAAGKSVEEVLKKLMAEEVNPSTTQPSATLSSDNIGAKEVGTSIAINYNISTDPGSYTYGPATGVTFSEYKATFNGQTLTGASGTFANVQVTDTMNLSISGSVKYSDGVIPETNLGNAYEEGQIKAATKSLSKGTLTGYRNWFYGYKAGGATIDAANLTSANIRALTPRNGSFPETISTNKMQQMFFAIPKGKKTDVSVANNVNGAPCTVTKVTDIMVEGANGYTAIAYDVWYVNNAAPDGGSNTYKITVK